MAPRRLGVLSLGFLRQPAIARILSLAGWRVAPGLRGAAAIGVWGRGRPARRGLWAARRTGLPVLSVEEPFLRGLRPGSSGTPPLGLLLDDLGIHFDASRPSRLERILASDPLDDGTEALEMWRRLGLSKVNQWSDEPAPEPGYVLVIDQMRGDASIAGGCAESASFRRMLEAARAENPGRQILIRTHPLMMAGRGTGHFTPADAGGRVGFAPPRLAPPALLNAAHRVYAVSSQMGFEAILLGHRPRLFGVPFYAGWGLSEDEIPCSRRRRALTPDMLFAGSMLRYPVWYDPFADALCDFETVAEIAADEAQAWREAAAPSVCLGVRAWKRPTLQGFLTGSGGRPVHASHVDRAVTLARRRSGRIAVWASREPPELAPACSAAGLPMLRIEDGFLRSLGLGAKLVPATSLVLDDLGIYFDPTRPSRLEMLIAQSAELSATELARAAALRAEICAQGVSKYGADLRRDVGPAFPPRAPGQRRVLVVGQVADDASVKLGATGDIQDNRAVLAAARAAHPNAFLVYRPHPDVTAGLRAGAIRAADLADAVVTQGNPASLLGQVDLVWTLTSLMGFEALIRGLSVTCLGAPFYAGWGLTQDLAPTPARRIARPGLDGLVHAALIAYPRYRDPLTGRACRAERIVARLASGDPRLGRPASTGLRLLARLQDRAAPFAGLWR